MPQRSAFRQLLGLLAWLVLCFATAAVGAIASVQARTFYQALVRPAWAPPGWVFGPVWTLLYALMGLAAWLVWREAGFRGGRLALSLFGVQLVANGLWSWLFFAWRRGALAFVDVVFLWLLILATTLAFWRVRRPAGLLLLPYLAWVAFATALTWAIWRANPGLLG